MARVLFILKRRDDYSAQSHSSLGLSTGLFNSASFVHQLLLDEKIESKLVVVVDNNSIDKEVTLYKPTHVIIEALWVVPPKFDILSKLHPTVKWIIRIHSDMPFMANEGIAMDWFGDYVRFPNVILSANSSRMLKEIRSYLTSVHNWTKQESKEKVIYLPNFYPQEYKNKKFLPSKTVINFGCFGAVRPLKNHLIQAVAAVAFAESKKRVCYFHINAGRIEMKVLRNLMFAMYFFIYGYSMCKTTIEPNRHVWGYICALVFLMLSIWGIIIFIENNENNGST